MMKKHEDDIPDFLKRTETEAQAEKRRAKYRKPDSAKGLSVVDPKIQAALAKDFADDEVLQTVQTVPKRPRGSVALKDIGNIEKFGQAVRESLQDAQKKEKSAVELINEARAKDGLRPYAPKQKQAEKQAKKAGKLVEQALQKRDELAARVLAKKLDAKQKSEAKKLAPFKTEKKTAKPAKKKNERAHYDWKQAEIDAAKGVIPKAPDFSAHTHRSYRGVLADVEKLVKAKDLKGLLKYKVTSSNGSRGVVMRYQNLAITALKFKKS